MTNHEAISSGLDSDIDNLIAQTRTEIPQLTPEVMTALREFDATDDLSVGNAVNVIGVFSGIKPTTVISEGGVGDSSRSIMNRMGLVFCDVNAETTVLSRYQELADTMADLCKKDALKYRSHDDVRTQRSVGKLLGFPETATEYFVERRKIYNDTGVLTPAIEFPGFEWSGVNGGMDNFRQFILSPDHAREEVEQYSEPLRQAVEIMTPHLYDRILEKSETVSSVEPRSNFLTRVVRYLGKSSVRDATKRRISK